MRGVHAYVVDSLDDTNSLVDIVGMYAKAAGVAKEGDKMVVVCGQQSGSGSNNQVKIEDITSAGIASIDDAAPTGSLKRGLSFSNMQALA